MKTVIFDRIVDKKVEFRNVVRLKTTTLQEDVPGRRQPVVQDSHSSSKSHNTAVQARYKKKPQEIAIPQIVNEDRSALLPSSALLLPTQTKLANAAL